MLEIKRNELTGGFFCVFQKGENWYYADLSNTPDRGIECMIFPCDSSGNVTDWGEVYIKYLSRVSEENLNECVNEFLNMAD